jgi:hypothetical protein
MSFALLAPVGLAALFALALPILIHLVRRIELRTTDFAALRWISERVRPRRRIRFERLWLLLLRLALLALLALLLARPVINEALIANRAWVAVAPGADPAAARASVVAADADWRWLAPGFPPTETTSVSTPVATASLLRELDAQLPRAAKLTVVVPSEVGGLDGERPLLSRAIDWRVVPGQMPLADAAKPRDAVTLAVRYAPSSQAALTYLDAAVSALNAHGTTQYRLDAQPHDVALDSATREAIWLGADLTPAMTAWIESGGTALTDHPAQSAGAPVWRDANGDVLTRVEPRGRGRIVALAGAFSPQTLPALLDADFPERLMRLLQGSDVAPTRASADVVGAAQGAAPSTASALSASTKPLDPWLAMLGALLFLAERIVATRRRVPA